MVDVIIPTSNDTDVGTGFIYYTVSVTPTNYLRTLNNTHVLSIFNILLKININFYIIYYKIYINVHIQINFFEKSLNTTKTKLSTVRKYTIFFIRFALNRNGD